MLEETYPSWRLMMLGAGASLLIPGVAAARAATAARAKMAQGIVQGTEPRGVIAFKGLRYGASTAGNGRFRAPRPPLGWDGVFDATDYGDQAPQQRTMLADPWKEERIFMDAFETTQGSAGRYRGLSE